MIRKAAILLALSLIAGPGASRADAPPPSAEGALRVASFNTALSRPGAGLAWKAIAEGRPQVRVVAEIIQRVRPDVLVLLEVDHDHENSALTAFVALLREGQGGAEGIDYPHLHAAPVNTGVPTGLDLNSDGDTSGPADAQGWGRYPGHYGMAVLSRLPLESDSARSFQLTLWRDMPGALIPPGHYPDGATDVLRLSSKSHWDLVARLPDGRPMHLLVSHPTPPVFDGPENRNGRRNHDEIRFWVDYIDGADWIRDDDGQPGGLPAGAGFVVLGDLNADPKDGAALREGLLGLLGHPRLNDPSPSSEGGVAAALEDGGANLRHRGDPAFDTARWRATPGPGNLRVDYALPSHDWEVTGAGVFWPPPGSPLARLVAGTRRPAGSDHRLVWVDLR